MMQRLTARHSDVGFSTQVEPGSSQRDGLHQRRNPYEALATQHFDCSSDSTAVDDANAEQHILGLGEELEYLDPFESETRATKTRIAHETIGMEREIDDSQYVLNLDDDPAVQDPDSPKTKSILGILGHWFHSLRIVQSLALPTFLRPTVSHIAVHNVHDSEFPPQDAKPQPHQPDNTTSASSKWKLAILLGVIIAHVTLGFHVFLNILKHGLTPLKAAKLAGLLLAALAVGRGYLVGGRGQREVLAMEHFWALAGFLAALALFAVCYASYDRVTT